MVANVPRSFRIECSPDDMIGFFEKFPKPILVVLLEYIEFDEKAYLQEMKRRSVTRHAVVMGSSGQINLCLGD